MNVATLKIELVKRSLTVAGNKTVLKERLLGAIALQRIPQDQHIEQEQPVLQVQPIQAPPAQDILTPVMVDAMNVATLKIKLAKRSLPVAGNKTALTERLLGVITSQQIPQDQPIEQEQHVLQVQPIQAPPAQDILTQVMMDAMNVATLKTELAKRGISTAGNKQPLKDRLLLVLVENIPIRAKDDTRAYPNLEDSFSATIHWVSLHHNEVPISNQTAEGFRAPTNRDCVEGNPFYEFNETFDRGVLSEKLKELELTRSGKGVEKDGRGRNKYFEKV